MQNLENISRQLERSGKSQAIKELAQSEDGRRLGAMIDAAAVARAAEQGDNQALRNVLNQVLSTQEGKRFAENVRKLMES